MAIDPQSEIVDMWELPSNFNEEPMAAAGELAAPQDQEVFSTYQQPQSQSLAWQMQ